MSKIDENSCLSSFFVFDSSVPPEEGASVDILYYYPEPKTPEEKNRCDVEAGISTTFLFFCKQFKPETPCDYVFTGKREIALLEISHGIFFNVSIHSNSPTRRLLLHQILKTCRDILFLTIGRPDPKKETISPQWRKLLQMHISSIVKVINWNDLVFELLWDAYSPYRSKNPSVIESLNKELDHLLEKYPMITSMIISWRDKVITFKKCDPMLCRLLTLLIFHKYAVFFPHKMKKREGMLYWTVGFSKDENGASQIYTPPIYWKDEYRPLCALQLDKIRIILLLNATAIENIFILRDFTVDLSEVLDNLNLGSDIQKTENYFGKRVGVNLQHKYKDMSLKITSNKIQVYDFSTIERGILLANEFSSKIASNSTGIIPLGNNFYSHFIHENNNKEIFTVMQFRSKNLQETAQTFNDLLNCFGESS